MDGFACLLVCLAVAFVQVPSTNGRALMVTTLLEPPFMMLKNGSSLSDHIPSDNFRFEGFIADLLKAINAETGIEFNVYIVEDKKYGQRNQQGEWTGMVGELVRREMDMAAAPLTRTDIREEAVDFSYPIMTSKMTALVHRDIHADSLEDLVNNTDISFGVIENSATEEALISATKPFLQRLWARIGSSENGKLETSKDGAMQARKGKFAFICEEPFGDYQASQPPCELTTYGSFLITDKARTYNLAFQKDEPSMKENITAINAALERMEKDQRIQEMYQKAFMGGECAGCVFTLSFSLLISSLFLTVSKFL